MKINPGRALVYCKKLIEQECSLCAVGATLHKSEEGNYQHRITFKELNVVARCDASNIWKFLTGETNVLE